MHFTPPSGIYIPDVVFTPTHTQGRTLWQAVMPPEISRISGALPYQIFLTSADGKTLPTRTGRITVQEGVISNMPETAEELGQYSISALYQLMANFYASLEGYRQTLDELAVKTHKWTILASDWTDSTPYQASIVFPHYNYAKPGTLILVAPADNRSREQICARLNAQPDVSFYIEHANMLIYNNGTEQELRSHVARLLQEVLK
jgi:hypothetical protein